MRTSRLLFVLASSLLSSACGAGALSAVRTTAAQEMNCPAASLTIANGNAAGRTDGAGPYFAEGCSQVWRYVAACNAYGYCPTVQGVNIGALVRTQAGFDLECDPSSLQLARLNTDTFGARGCGRQASYIAICTGGTCRIAQNTQTQRTTR